MFFFPQKKKQRKQKKIGKKKAFTIWVYSFFTEIKALLAI